MERSVRALRARGLRVAVVKHSHHPPDLRGKDTARALRAGASIVVFSGATSFVLFRGDAAPIVGRLPVDVVIVEGHSRRRFGPHRFHIRSASEAAEWVRTILTLAPRRRAPSIVLHGRRRRADPYGEFVVGLTVERGVRRVERRE